VANHSLVVVNVANAHAKCVRLGVEKFSEAPQHII